MSVMEVPEIPADAVDVTEQVNDLKERLHEVLKGEDVMVSAMAIGSLIGESFDDEELIRQLLHNLSHMAAVVFAASNFPEGEGTVH